MKNTQQRLLRRISALDFAIYEMVLYLDAHPHSSAALKQLAQYRAERAKAVEEYERIYGKYITTCSDAGHGNHWEWVDSPWPWENEGNE